jgi:hypothetical protein
MRKAFKFRISLSPPLYFFRIISFLSSKVKQIFCRRVAVRIKGLVRKNSYLYGGWRINAHHLQVKILQEK